MSVSKAGLMSMLDTILFRSRRMNTGTPITSSRTLTHSDMGYNVVDATAGPITITLPLANTNLGPVDFILRRKDDTANAVNVVVQGTDTLELDDTYTTVAVPAKGHVWMLRSDGAGKWYSVTPNPASVSQMQAGTEDSRYVTPLKLRLGFSANISSNGYIVFPTWLGGIILQWGNNTANPTANAPKTISFPLVWPNACYAVLLQRSAQGSAADVNSQVVGVVTLNSFPIYSTTSGATFYWFAAGR